MTKRFARGSVDVTVQEEVRTGRDVDQDEIAALVVVAGVGNDEGGGEGHE